MTAPPAPAAAAGPSTVATAGPGAPHTAPAPPATHAGSVLALTITNPDGHVVLTTRIGQVDPVREAGGFAPIDPPAWNQAVWVRYRPLISPADTDRGTSYVYGHACHHHVCAFTRLARVTEGASIVVRTGGSQARYVVTRTSANFPKEGPGSLADRSSGVADRSVGHRLVLITCAYERGDLSLNNFVVIAKRQTAPAG